MSILSTHPRQTVRLRLAALLCAALLAAGCDQFLDRHEYQPTRIPADVDRFLIMAGRLDMPRVVVDGALNGVWHHFPNGGEPVRDPTLQPVTNQHFIELRIAGAAAHDRYTARLAGTDLSRVIYVYGTADDAIGRLSEAEDSFLRSRGSTVIAVEGGGHGSMFEDPETIRRILAALQE